MATTPASEKQAADGDETAQFDEPSVFISGEHRKVIGEELSKTLDQHAELTRLRDQVSQLLGIVNRTNSELAACQLVRDSNAQTIAAYEKEVANAIREVVGAIKGEKDAKRALEVAGARNIELAATVRFLERELAIRTAP